MDDRKRMGRYKKGIIIPVAPAISEISGGYEDFIEKIKENIRQQRLNVVFQANYELNYMYWQIGKAILKKQNEEGWGTNIVLMDKISNVEERIWYAQQAIENGWSRNILSFQIETKLYTRMGQSVNNFKVALPPQESDMANQIFKDPFQRKFNQVCQP